MEVLKQMKKRIYHIIKIFNTPKKDIVKIKGRSTLEISTQMKVTLRVDVKYYSLQCTE